MTSRHSHSLVLHALLAVDGPGGWGELDEKNQYERLALVRQLLGQGADPNQRNAHGLSPLGVLCANTSREWAADEEQMQQALAEVLLDAGAEPLTGDVPLYTAPTQIMAHMLDRLSQSERLGHRPRTKRGDNPLHAVMSRAKPCTQFLEIDRSCLHPEWINEVNGKGQTPLHVLFETNGWVWGAVDRHQNPQGQARPNDRALRNLSERVWSIAQILVAMGARWPAVDAEGRQCGELALRTIRLGLVGDGPVAKTVLADIHAATIDSDTPPSSLVFRGGRL